MRYTTRSISSITTALQNSIRKKFQLDHDKPIPKKDYKKFQEQIRNKIAQQYKLKNDDIQQQLRAQNVNGLWGIWHQSLVQGIQEFFAEMEADSILKTCDPRMFEDIGGPTFLYEPLFQQVTLHRDDDETKVEALPSQPKHYLSLKQLRRISALRGLVAKFTTATQAQRLEAERIWIAIVGQWDHDLKLQPNIQHLHQEQLQFTPKFHIQIQLLHKAIHNARTAQIREDRHASMQA
eukprot:1801987-Karenia_brevis.AAC.1